MPLFNVELSLKASIVVVANSEDDALQKVAAAHKAGIDPARAWFSDDMFDRPDFSQVEFDGEERASRLLAQTVADCEEKAQCFSATSRFSRSYNFVEEWSRAVGQSIGISLSITRTTHWPVEKSKIDVEVGARIRVTRKLLGLSQTALAERLGFTFQQVQNTKRAAIASDLAAFKSQRNLEIATVERLFGSSDGAALNKAFVQISDPRRRKAIISLVKTLAADDSESAFSRAIGEATAKFSLRPAL